MNTEAMKDFLTGAYSRNYFQQRFHEEIERAHRYQLDLSVLLVDIDHFKSINDAFGHRRGDEILRLVSERLGSGIRGSDILFRYGGDEFVLLLPNTSKEHCITFADRLIASVTAENFPGTPPLKVTISGGVAALNMDAIDPATLFDKADLRCLEAKRKGRAMVISSDPTAPSNIPFDSLSRLLERDAEFHEVHQFIEAINHRKRGQLLITGTKASGRSFFLREVKQLAELHGFETLMLRCDPIQTNRSLAPLESIAPYWKYSIRGCNSVDSYIKAFEKLVESDNVSSLIILVDDAGLLDISTAEVLKSLLKSEKFSKLAVCSTIETESLNIAIPSESMFYRIVELSPLSRQGLQILLRELLKTELTGAFHEWLFRESRGLPGNIRKILTYLTKRGILFLNADQKWLVASGYSNLYLQDRIDLENKPIHHNLPALLCDFVGRQMEIGQVIRAIQDNRLVSLVGPGGVGKTRFAIRAAWEMVSRFKKGVFLVDLSVITSSEFIISAIADAMFFSFQPAGESKTQLIDYLREKQILLILDCFDEVMSGAALINEIIQNCPSVKILTTSLQPLNLQGEIIIRVKSLTVPSIDDVNFDDYDVIQLFYKHAKYADPAFEIKDSNRPHIRRICLAVDGLPLGVQLAAPWIRMLPCEEIAGEIEKDLGFLKTNSPSVQESHRSLRIVFEQAFKRLPPDYSRLLNRLSVFQGEFNRQAAIDVAGASLEFLLAMIDRSLIEKCSPDRFRIASILKQFIGEAFDRDADDKARVELAHSTYYIEFLQRQISNLQENTAVYCLEQIAAEIDNIRFGWIYSAKVRNIKLLQRYSENMSTYFDRRALYREGLELTRMIQSVLETQEKQADDGSLLKMILGKLYHLQGSFMFGLSDYGSADKCFSKSLSIFQAEKSDCEIGMALNGLGGIAARHGDHQKAKEFYDQSLTIRRKSGDTLGVASSLNNLGNVISSMGDHKQALQMYEEALQIVRELGDKRAIASLLANVGISAGIMGDIDYEEKLLLESYTIRKDIGDRSGLAISIDHLGSVETFKGNYEKAKSLLYESLAIRRQIGDRSAISTSLINLSHLLHLTGEEEERRKMLEEALGIYREIGDRWGIALCLTNLGGLLTHLNQTPRARSLLDLSQRIFQEIKDQAGSILVKLNMGALEEKEAHYSIAFRIFFEAFQSALQMSSVQYAIRSLNGLASVFKADNRLPQAVEIFSFLDASSLLSRKAKENVMKNLEEIKRIMSDSEFSASSSKGETYKLEDFSTLLQSESYTIV